MIGKERVQQIAKPVHAVIESHGYALDPEQTEFESYQGTGSSLLIDTFNYRGGEVRHTGTSVYCALEVKRDENSIPNNPILELDVALQGRIKKPLVLCAPGFSYQSDIEGGMTPEVLVDYVALNDVDPTLAFLLGLNKVTPVFTFGDNGEGIGFMKWSGGA